MKHNYRGSATKKEIFAILLLAMMTHHITSKKKGHGHHHGVPTPPPIDPPPPSIGDFEWMRPRFTLPSRLSFNPATGKIDGNQIDITLPWVLGSPPGTLHSVSNQAQFDTALGAAVYGDEIVVTSGITLTPIILPAKGGFDSSDPLKQIIIRPSGVAGLPTLANNGDPATSAFSASMFTVLQSSALDSQPVIGCANGAKGYRIIGARGTTSKPTNYEDALFRIRPDAGGDANKPSHIYFDRCLALGNDIGVRRGFEVGGDEFLVHQCAAENINDASTSDSQCVATDEGINHGRVTRNFLEGVSENIIFGGGGSTLTEKNPRNIEIRGNYLVKKPSWNGVQTELKNHFELKKGREILFEGNWCVNSWDRAQPYSQVYQSNSQGNLEPEALCQDITVRFNKFTNIFSFVGISDRNGTNATVGANRIEVAFNLQTEQSNTSTNPGVLSAALQPHVLAKDIVFRYNTVAATLSFLYLSEGPIPPGSTNWGIVVDNNIQYVQTIRAVFGPAGIGNETELNTSYLNSGNWSFKRNVILQASSLPLSVTLLSQPNFQPTSIAFVNASSGDFTLPSDSPYKGLSTDGKDPGVYMPLLTELLAGVGASVPPPAPECDIITSTANIPTSALSKPSYLTPVTEPNFGTKLIRISGDVGTPIPTVGGNWSNLTHHQYSKSQAWNADQTLLYLSEMGGALGAGVQLFLDGATYAPLFSGNHPGPDARWHPTLPSVMICNTATGGIVHWNPVTDVTTPKFTTTNYNNAFLGNYESQPSNDGRWIAINAIRNSDGKAVMYAVDIDTGVKTVDIDLVANGITTLDFCTVSPSGTYLLAFGIIDGVDQRIKIFLKDGTLVQYWNDLTFGHLDLAYDVDGNEVVFGSAGVSHQFLMRQMNNGLVTFLTGAWTSFNWHASCRNINRPGWGYACVNDDTGFLLDLEIVAIKLSAANQIERLGRHRTNDVDFDSAALVSSSPDGKRVIFGSNWGEVSGRPVSTYIIDVRDICP